MAADALEPERLVGLLGAAEGDPDPQVSAQATAALSALARLSTDAR